jgi:hypothetical protein
VLAMASPYWALVASDPSSAMGGSSR